MGLRTLGKFCAASASIMLISRWAELSIRDLKQNDGSGSIEDQYPSIDANEIGDLLLELLPPNGITLENQISDIAVMENHQLMTKPYLLS